MSLFKEKIDEQLDDKQIDDKQIDEQIIYASNLVKEMSNFKDEELTEFNARDTSAIKNQCLSMNGKYFYFECEKDKCMVDKNTNTTDNTLKKHLHVIMNSVDDINKCLQEICNINDKEEYTGILEGMKTEIKNLNDGVYTWLIDKNKYFYFTRVYSIQEIGSTHSNIVNLVLKRYPSLGNGFRILGGGEFKKTEGKIQYNILSGTYTRDKIETLSDENRDNYITKLKFHFENTMEPLLGQENVEFKQDSYEDTFINEINLKVTKETFMFWLGNGVEITMFENEENCKLRRNYPIRAAKKMSEYDRALALARRFKDSEPNINDYIIKKPECRKVVMNNSNSTGEEVSVDEIFNEKKKKRNSPDGIYEYKKSKGHETRVTRINSF